MDPFFDLQRNTVIDANWQVIKARIVAQDRDNDIAIIQADRNPFTNPPRAPIKMGDKEFGATHFASAKLNANLPEQGTRVYVTGFPLGQAYMIVQEGTIAAVALSFRASGVALRSLFLQLPTMAIVAPQSSTHPAKS